MSEEKDLPVTTDEDSSWWDNLGPLKKVSKALESVFNLTKEIAKLTAENSRLSKENRQMQDAMIVLRIQQDEFIKRQDAVLAMRDRMVTLEAEVSMLKGICK